MAAATVLGCLALVLVSAEQKRRSHPCGASSQVGAPLDLDPAVLVATLGTIARPEPRLSIAREGTQLFAQLNGQPRAKIFAKSDSEFFYKVVQAQISFQADARGQTTGAGASSEWAHMDAPRIDAAARSEDYSRQRSKSVKARPPHPEATRALRRLIQGILTDKPNYSEMTPSSRASCARASCRTWRRHEAARCGAIRPSSAASAARAGICTKSGGARIIGMEDSAWVTTGSSRVRWCQAAVRGRRDGYIGFVCLRRTPESKI